MSFSNLFSRPLQTLSLFALSLCYAMAQAQDAAQCEIALFEPMMENDQVVEGVNVFTYGPAEDFMASAFDDQDGYMLEMEGKPIRAIFCTRETIMPTLRDFEIVKSGLPLSLSPDFDAPDSPILTVFYADSRYQHRYVGPELSNDDIFAINDTLEAYNLQPENTPITNKDAKLVETETPELSFSDLSLEGENEKDGQDMKDGDGASDVSDAADDKPKE